MLNRSLLAVLLAAFALPAAAQMPAQLSSPVGRAIPGRYLVTYRSGAQPWTAPAGTRLLARHAHLEVSVLAGSSAAAAALAQDASVESVVADRMVSAHATTARAASSSTASAAPGGWATQAVGGFGGNAGHPGPWSVTRGRGVRIAILDSGVDATHPNLAPNLALNLSEIDQAALPSPCDDGSPADQQGHGTWTASLAAGALGYGADTTAGVAPEATLLNIKVLERMPGAASAQDPSGCTAGQASGLLSWVLQGIEDAVANHADIVSLSLGTLVDITTGDGAGVKTTLDHATHAAFAAGTVVIAAAGNDGLDLSNQRYMELPAQGRDVVAIVASTNPACAENLAAGAVCALGPVTRPYYSNFGTPLNALAAPGGSYPAGPDAGQDADTTAATGWIRGACSGGKPGTTLGLPADATHSLACFGLGKVASVEAMGTSASAPLAAGAAALLLAAHRNWDAATLVASLRSSAVSLPGLPVAQVSVTAAVRPADDRADPILSQPLRLP